MSRCSECGAESGIGFEKSHWKAHKQWQKQVDAMPPEDVPELPAWATIGNIPIMIDDSLPDGTICGLDAQGNTVSIWKDVSLSNGTAYYRTHPESMEEIRKLVREAVHEELKEVIEAITKEVREQFYTDAVLNGKVMLGRPITNEVGK